MDKKKPPAISQKLRFDVFKRDAFKCQYCGASAPDVILHVDHIHPKSKGGKNSITNLITACKNCNSGKGAIPLSDMSAVEKQRIQMEEINERREQLKLIAKWRDELDNYEAEQVQVAVKEFEKLGSCMVNKYGTKKLTQWVKRFGITTVLDAISVTTRQYLVYNDEDDGTFTQESRDKAFNYIPRICVCTQVCKEKPYMKDLYYIRGILRNRVIFSQYSNANIINALESAHVAGWPIESLKKLASECNNWTAFKSQLSEFIHW